MRGFDAAQILVLSTIDWDAAWQRHQIFATQFAASGRQVFFIENSGFRNPRLTDAKRVWERLWHILLKGRSRARAGVEVTPPSLLPPTRTAFRKINESLLIPRLAARLGAGGLRAGAIAIVYIPTATTLSLLDKLRPRLIVYDCASHFAGHPDAPPDFSMQEDLLLSRAHVVVTDSQFLYDRLAPRHRNVRRIHQGVDDSFVCLRPRPPRYRSFCYYGTWGQGLDPELPAALAAAGLEVTVSGFMKNPSPPLPPGVRHLPPVPREELLERLKAFDAFFLPYRLTTFHQGVIPAKLYELLALGRPTISTPLLSMREFERYFYIAKTPEDWIRIAQGLADTETDAKVRMRTDLAGQHTYSSEFARLQTALRDAWDASRPS